MGFSSEAVFIKSAIPEEQYTELLSELGFTNILFKGKAYFGEADGRGKQGVYIGNYKDCTLLIYDDILNGHRDQNNFSHVEQVLTSFLPENHEILSLLNIESVNGYCYHYIVNGQTRRLKYGSYDGDAHEIGEELPLEKRYYTRKEKRGNDTIYSTTSPDGQVNEWTHDQIGGSIAFLLAAMMIGERYDDIPQELEMHQYIIAGEPVNGQATETKPLKDQVTLMKDLPVTEELINKNVERLQTRSARGGALIVIGLITLVIGFFTSIQMVLIGGALVLTGWLVRSSAQKELKKIKV